MKSIARESRRAATYVTSMFLLCTLAGCIAPGSIHETLTCKAWQYYNARDCEQAIDAAQECLDEFAGEAARIQVKLEKDGVEIPPTGRVSASQKAEVFKNGVLNDVATCYYIIGRCNEYLGRADQARSAYAEARKLAYARCWDPKGWFWDPAQTSADRAKKLAP